jgi:hypothetical protein
MAAGAEGADDGLPAGATERGERPRTAIVGIVEFVVDEPRQRRLITDIDDFV